MAKFSRDKGKRGERLLAGELTDLLGVKIERRVRNNEGENDLTGLDGWSPEVKNCDAPRYTEWWKQTVAQAGEKEIPVLFVKLPRKPFRAFIPLWWAIGGGKSDDFNYTLEMSLEAFAAVYRETLAVQIEHEQAEQLLNMPAGGAIQ